MNIQRKKASDFDQRILEYFDGYVHGKMSKRDFIAKAGLEATIRYLSLDLGHKNVRVNGISAGPIRTLAASGVSGMRGLLHDAADQGTAGGVELERISLDPCIVDSSVDL